MSEHAHPIFARLYDPIMAGAERTVLVEHREYLAEGLDGRVLDVGTGTGAMFPYFEDSSVELHAIEPDPHMRAQARERAADLDIDLSLVDGEAESLPFEDRSFDAVISALVFCTVPDPEAGAAEIARVLEPTGEFRFLEHVRAAGPLGRVHDAATPVWETVAGGCQLNRETGEHFLSMNEFTVTDFERFEGSVGLAPMVRGRLVRRPELPGAFDRLFDLVG